MKKIEYGANAVRALARGTDKLARAVVSTLGPRSRNVAIGSTPPLVVHDGVTVAREVKLQDEFEDLGATLVREAATKTNFEVGDGTTTATLLANTLVQKGMALIMPESDEILIGGKYNPMRLREQIDVVSEWVENELGKMSRKADTKAMKSWVAEVSSGSVEIGKIVAEALSRVGDDGLVVVEESSSVDTTVEYQDGMEFDNGYISPYFITDAGRGVANYSGGEHYVLVTDHSVADPMLLVPIIEKVMKEGQNKKALLIIASDVVAPALQSLIATKLKVGAPLVAVQAPEFGERREQMLEDIAILTGGVFISQGRGMKLQEMGIGELGRAKSIIVSQHSTMITPLNPDKDEIAERCNLIKKQIAEETVDFRKEKLQNRLAKLQQGVAVIQVGGKSMTEMLEMKERVIDASHATRAAIRDGVVAGGGVALYSLAKRLDEVEVDDEVRELMRGVLSEPLRRLLINSGLDESLMDLVDGNTGVDMKTGALVDMFKSGIIDPAKVTKKAVRNSFSVAAMILTTETLIVDAVDTDVQKIRVVNANI